MSEQSGRGIQDREASAASFVLHSRGALTPDVGHDDEVDIHVVRKKMFPGEAADGRAQ